VTKLVLCFLTASKVLKANTASKRLLLGALSLGRVLVQFSANSRVVSRTQPEGPILLGARTDLRSLCLPAKLC
jgi:hypothetical protein